VSSEEVKEKVKEVIRRSGCLVIVGPPGCGKTHAIQRACEELGYRVVEYDALEVSPEELRRVATTIMIARAAVVVDILDCVPLPRQAELVRAVRLRVNPVVFTAYGRSGLAQEVEKVCEVVQMWRPDVRELSRFVNQLARERGLKPNYHALNSRDWRQAILSLYGSHGYSEEDTVRRTVEEFFRTGRLERTDPSTLVAVADNVGGFYGVFAYLLLRGVAAADMARRPEPLEVVGELLKGRLAKPKPSYFLEKLRLVRGG
jgi:hypothetical protein